MRCRSFFPLLSVRCLALHCVRTLLISRRKLEAVKDRHSVATLFESILRVISRDSALGLYLWTSWRINIHHETRDTTNTFRLREEFPNELGDVQRYIDAPLCWAAEEPTTTGYSVPLPSRLTVPIPDEMFFLYELERVISLHPSFFGPRVKEYLTNRLLEDVEGTCTGQYYIICVMDTYDISEGRVIPGSAVAEYTVHYRAVVWRPFKGETVSLRRDGERGLDVYVLI